MNGIKATLVDFPGVLENPDEHIRTQLHPQKFLSDLVDFGDLPILENGLVFIGIQVVVLDQISYLDIVEIGVV